MLKLLEKARDHTAYEAELEHLVLELNCHETEYLSRLKSSKQPGQWSAVFELLLEKTKHASGKMHLYYFEERYAELFEQLCQHPSFGSFTCYEAELRQWNPERTLKLYTELLKQEMDKACDRKQYRHVASQLDKLKAYPSGQETARAIAEYWYVYHKNRPAMKDELKKAGYPQK